MLSSLTIWLTTITLAQLTHAYADFGTVTAPCNSQSILTVPRPKFIPDDVYMRYEPYSSSITAVAPSLRLGSNGTHETSWSLHFVQPPTRTTSTQVSDHELRKRGVFSGDPVVPTCRPCDKNGNPIDNTGSNNNTSNGSPSCSITSYDGVFRDGVPSTSSLPSYCFNSGYTGPLVPSSVPTDVGLPCCPVCYPPGINATFSATTGVFSSLSTTPGAISTTTTTSKGSSRSTSKSTTASAKPGSNAGKTTLTVTATEPATSTRVTLSIETVTPTGTVGSPVVTTAFNTIIGCGTASGCGKVVGSGTVYLAPLGYPAVTSSGTVSGCAPKVIGCGTMIATRGVFTATDSGTPATITGCGEGTGSATLIGSGTVWPAGFNDMVSFVSVGTVTGSGRVRGCGIITGVGTFTVSEPYTTTSTKAAIGSGVATVNVYVSYCPPEERVDGMSMNRMAGNFSDDVSSPALLSVDDLEDPPDSSDSDPPNKAYRYTVSDISAANRTSLTTNSTFASNITVEFPCHICPLDSICCPPFTDCDTDGHCPWTALEACGYVRFGVYVVNMHNSSGGGVANETGFGVEELKAPGLPGTGMGTEIGVDGDVMGTVGGMERRNIVRNDGRGRGRVHGHGYGHGYRHR